MQRLLLTLRLQSPVLGGAYQQQIWRFKYDRDGAMCVDLDMWAWLFENAFGLISPSIYPRSVRMERVMVAPKVTMYSRRFSNRGQGRGDHVLHECIGKNTVLNMPLLIVSPEPADVDVMGRPVRKPTMDELQDAIKIIGRDLGISEFGKHLGYGRFTVENLITIGTLTCAADPGRNLPDHLALGQEASSTADGQGEDDGEEREVGADGDAPDAPAAL